MPETHISAEQAGELWRAVKESNSKLRSPYPFENFPEPYAVGIILSEYPTAVEKDGKLSAQGAKRIVGLLRSEAGNYRRRKLFHENFGTAPIEIFEVDDLIDPTEHIKEIYHLFSQALEIKIKGGDNMGELANRVREKIAALSAAESGLGKREDAIKTYEQDATSGLYNAVKPHWESAPSPADGEGLPQYAERLTGGLTEMVKGVAEKKADVEEAADAIEVYLKK